MGSVNMAIRCIYSRLPHNECVPKNVKKGKKDKQDLQIQQRADVVMLDIVLREQGKESQGSEREGTI
jgi:hypothetical protein